MFSYDIKTYLEKMIQIDQTVDEADDFELQECAVWQIEIDH